MEENKKQRAPRTPRAPEGMVDTKRAAVITGYAPLTLQQLCAANSISHVKRGRSYFFTPADLAALLPHFDAVAPATNPATGESEEAGK